MPHPRHILVHDERPGAYHVISRCVRRAFLCGDQAEHRRAWVRDLIRQAAGAFAVDVLAYAVMSSATTRQRPTGRRTTVGLHHDATAAGPLADPEDDHSRPNRAGFVLSEVVG